MADTRHRTPRRADGGGAGLNAQGRKESGRAARRRGILRPCGGGSRWSGVTCVSNRRQERRHESGACHGRRRGFRGRQSGRDERMRRAVVRCPPEREAARGRFLAAPMAGAGGWRCADGSDHFDDTLRGRAFERARERSHRRGQERRYECKCCRGSKPHCSPHYNAAARKSFHPCADP